MSFCRGCGTTMSEDDGEYCAMCAGPKSEPAPAPSEEAYAVDEYDPNCLLCRRAAGRPDAGLDDSDICEAHAKAEVKRLRSQLARKDEGLLAEIAKARASIARSQIDEEDWWDGYAAALDDVSKDAIREPDGRKGE